MSCPRRRARAGHTEGFYLSHQEGADGPDAVEVGGAFLLERAVTLLVFAGVWAMVNGITDIIRAFQIRALASN